MDKNKCSSCDEAPHKCSCKNKDNTLIGNKTGGQLGLQDKLTAGDNITIEDNVISATDTTYIPASAH